MRKSLFLLGACLTLGIAASQVATARDKQGESRATREAAADRWAADTEAKMTDEERFSLIHGFMALKLPGSGSGKGAPGPHDVVPGAG